MATIQINGVDIPAPIRGLNAVVSTNVNTGRNANGEMIGERVGRDLYKLDNLEWRMLTREQWNTILTLMSDFRFTCTFPDVVNGGTITLTCYCGDRTCEPYYIDDSGDFTYYRSCKVNIIDCGYVSEGS